MEQDITTTTAYKAAETYERFFVTGMFNYWTPLLLQRAAPQPGERVLDVACGTGVVARSMVPLVGSQGQVVGLDINPAMLEVACKQFSIHCEAIDWREGRAEDLPFPAKDFDLVTCQHGLQFFKNRPVTAREMRRVLRQKGRVVIAVWQSIEHNPFFESVYAAIASVCNVAFTALASPYAFGDPDALKNLLVEAGFHPVQVESVRQEVHFQEVERFVELTIRSSSAVIPAFAELERNLRIELQSRVTQQLSGLIREHTVDGSLTFPMLANIATGVA